MKDDKKDLGLFGYENESLTDEIAHLKMCNVEQEQKIKELSKELATYKLKDASISEAIISAVDKAKQIEDSSKKIYQLEIQRLRLLYMRLEQNIKQLQAKYPELKDNPQLEDMAEKFKTSIFKEFESSENPPLEDLYQSYSNTNPIKKMLEKINSYYEKKGKPVETKTIETLKPVEKSLTFDIPNEHISKSRPVSSSGFDINEALHPTQALDDILKVFDLGFKDKDGK